MGLEIKIEVKKYSWSLNRSASTLNMAWFMGVSNGISVLICAAFHPSLIPSFKLVRFFQGPSLILSPTKEGTAAEN